jgi:drug/metabolite transporter (DMT)-like permease
MDKEKKIGMIAIAIASIIWAIEPILVKLSYRNSDFLETILWRVIGIIFIAGIYIIYKNNSNFKIRKKDLSKLLYLTIAGTVVADLLFFYALSELSVVNAIILGHVQPVFIILLGFFLLHENLSWYDYTGIFVMIVAAIFVTTGSLTNLLSFHIGSRGDLLLLIATVLWASTAVVAKKHLTHMDSGVLVFYRMLLSMVIFLPYFIYTSSIGISNWYQVANGLLVGVGCILYYEGLKRLKTAQVSALELLAPFFAAVLSYFILGEKITIMQIAGIALLVFGVYLISHKNNHQ